MEKVSAIVVAGGSSSRMAGVDKLDLRISGATVLQQAVERMAANALISEVVVVARAARVPELRQALADFTSGKPLTVVAGGDTRFKSVQNGVAAVQPDAGYIAIHDAARPFVGDDLITRVIEAAMRYGAAAPGVPVVDTIKSVDGTGRVTETLARDILRAIATPQVFKKALYIDAATRAASDDALDDCTVAENAGYPVFIVPGDRGNIKITTREDLERIEAGGRAMRIGHGYDVHRFEAGRKLILGGVEISFEMGLLGHSDADVLAHAVSDAVLGAAGMGDIGTLFPDTDEAYAGADSIALLVEVARRLDAAGFAVENVDATVVCQRPRLADKKAEMKRNIAGALGIGERRVNVKATTEEGLGFTGEMQGVAAHAVALLTEKTQGAEMQQ